MLILTDSSGVTIKRRIQDANHVRIEVTHTAFWVDGVRRVARPNRKPYCEYSLNDCSDFLAELDCLERGV